MRFYFFNSTCKYAISGHLFIIFRFIVVSSLFYGGREECLSCAYNYCRVERKMPFSIIAKMQNRTKFYRCHAPPFLLVKSFRETVGHFLSNTNMYIRKGNFRETVKNIFSIFFFPFYLDFLFVFFA